MTDPKKNNKLHMIGNAHIDPVWLWRWPEGLAEIKATFLSALDRLDEFDQFVFTCAGAAYYQWIEQNEPDMFERIKKRVQQGRWVIVNGWQLQPDCNIPCGESFVRQGLYAQHYYQKTFGRIAKTGYNVDSFGHNANLPQILSKLGMSRYVFMRPSDHENPDVPQLFRWESPDGTRVLTYKIPFSYTTNGRARKDSDSSIENRIENAFALAEEKNIDIMGFYGVGNHGGGPTILEIEAIERLIKERYQDSLQFSDPDRYFDQLEDTESLPVYRHDLQHHASGCYSAVSKIKVMNNDAENRLMAAEKASALSSLLIDDPVDPVAIKKHWEPVLFNQFHDILCGCSIEEAMEDAYEWYGSSLTGASKILHMALQRVAWRVDTARKGQKSIDKRYNPRLWMNPDIGSPFVAFNLHMWPTHRPIECQAPFTVVRTDDGKPIQTQVIRASRTNGEDKYGVLLDAPLPAYGYQLFWGWTKEQKNEQTDASSDLSISEHEIQNDCIVVSFDPQTGHISRLFDKREKRDVLASNGGIPVVVNEEHCDTWSHDVFSFREDIGVFSDARFTILETGPIRAVLRVESFYGNSTLTTDYAIYKNRNIVDIRMRVVFLEKHRMLKMSFPVAGEQFVVQSGIAYGMIEKKDDGCEEAFQDWVMIKNEHDRALGIVCKDRYAYDARCGDLRITCLRTPIYADHYGQAHRDAHCRHSDIGEHTIEMTLCPQSKPCPSELSKMAAESGMQTITVPHTIKKGVLGPQASMISIDNNDVRATVFKPDEQKPGCYILRVVETANRNTKAVISLPALQRTFEAVFAPCEIKTFLIDSDRSHRVVETDLLERPLCKNKEGST